MAFLGNMNNNHFAMVRYLRDAGVEADVLLVDNETPHFHPSCDTDNLEYQSYVHRLPWGSVRSFVRTPKAQIRSDLESYDWCGGAGLAPAFTYKAGQNLDAFIPYGYDLWNLTRYRAAMPHWLRYEWPAVRAQRKGVRASRFLHMPHNDVLYEKRSRVVAPRTARIKLGIPLIYAPMYDSHRREQLLTRTHWAHEFAAVRDDADLLLFSAVRHHWLCDAGDPSAKGNDRLLRAIAKVKDLHPDLRIRLITIEYGQDVVASKRLVRSLGIEKEVRWFPGMFRKDLMMGLSLSDIACTEFHHSWINGGTIYEALVLNKPILGFRNEAVYAKEAKPLYPIMNARREGEIVQQLTSYLRNPTEYVTLSAGGAVWYQREVVEPVVRLYSNFAKNEDQIFPKTIENLAG